MIELGDTVKDRVTDFVGITIAKTEYKYGCIQFLVQPKINKDSEIPDNAWIDEPQLELIQKAGEDKPEPAHGGKRSHPK